MKIKICGLTTLEDAAILRQYPVDYAGIVVFCPQSKRNCSLEQAERIRDALPAEIKTVAVTISPGLKQIRQLEAFGFDHLQIHGELQETLWEQLRIPVWKAFNGLEQSQWKRYQKLEAITGYVLDAKEPGSGQPFDWQAASRLPETGKSILLAGGLTPENVGRAIRIVHPDGVDVSTGVERDSGRGKDPEKVRRFVEAVEKSIKS